ncbi:hypothetical protein ACPPVU_21270 [Mucilaginibacter sp. McL0603]|uniref:hypothetical protein n=1 Tax=Mucilaginibacter sp. McL0603 TaxID=3415670 RepID=UPI003CEA99EF
MKQQEVFKKIGIIIKELNDQYNYLVENENELNDLELELFVANARFLADHSEVLQKLNLQNTPPQKFIPVTEEKYFEPVVQQVQPTAETQPVKEQPIAALPPDTPAEPVKPKTSAVDTNKNPVPHIDLRGDDTGTDYSYIRQSEPEIIRHELTLDDIPNWENEDEEPEEPLEEEISEPEEEVVAEVPKPVVEAKNELIRSANEIKPIEQKETKVVEHKKEEPKEETLTINQRISAQLKNAGSRIAEHVNGQPITDLKQAITLNDKLLYIKDLFNGYNLAYSEAIDILNRFNSFDEADKFLKTNYAVKNNWESKQATTDKFYKLLTRRYS